MNDLKEAFKRLGLIRVEQADTIIKKYSTIVYCNTCGDRVGQVEKGSDRVDITCPTCVSTAEALIRARAKILADKEKANGARNNGR